MSNSLVFELVKNEHSNPLVWVFNCFKLFILHFRIYFINLLSILQTKVLEAPKIYAAYY